MKIQDLKVNDYSTTQLIAIKEVLNTVYDSSEFASPYVNMLDLELLMDKLNILELNEYINIHNNQQGELTNVGIESKKRAIAWKKKLTNSQF